jgi:hypothetical protein
MSTLSFLYNLAHKWRYTRVEGQIYREKKTTYITDITDITDWRPPWRFPSFFGRLSTAGQVPAPV